MKVQNKGNKGNPYHDDEGKFTTGEINYSGDFSLDDFLNSFNENDIDSFLGTIETTETFDFKPILDKLLKNKNNRKKIIDAINDQLNDAPDKFKKVIFNFLSKSKINKIKKGGNQTCFVLNAMFPFLSEIRIRDADIFNSESLGHKKGTAIVHEIFHAIDYLYNDNGKLLSQSYVLSNGKTFRKVVDEEVFSIKNKNNFFQDLRNDFDAEIKNEYVKNGISLEIVSQIKQIEDEQKNALEDVHVKQKLFPTFNDFQKELLNTIKQYDSKLEKYKKERDIIKNIKKKTKLNFTLISDICESIDTYNSFTDFIGYGHGGVKTTYWKKDTRRQSKELFAEIAESMALSKENFNNFQKYFPNSVKAFQEILDSISA